MGRGFKDIKHELNPSFDKLLSDADHGKLDKKYSSQRPAYAYTSQCFEDAYKDGFIGTRLKAGKGK